MARHTTIGSETGDVTVETWYDRQSCNWITQIKDAEGNQIGDALFSGTRDSATCDHKSAVKRAWEIVDERENRAVPCIACPDGEREPFSRLCATCERLMPNWVQSWDVDVIIETWEGVTPATETLFAKLAPDAYHDLGVSLARVWLKLDDAARENLTQIHNRLVGERCPGCDVMYIDGDALRCAACGRNRC